MSPIWISLTEILSISKKCMYRREDKKSSLDQILYQSSKNHNSAHYHIYMTVFFIEHVHTVYKCSFAISTTLWLECYSKTIYFRKYWDENVHIMICPLLHIMTRPSLVVRQQAIIWTNVDQVLCSKISSPWSSVLIWCTFMHSWSR